MLEMLSQALSSGTMFKDSSSRMQNSAGDGLELEEMVSMSERSPENSGVNMGSSFTMWSAVQKYRTPMKEMYC